MMNYRALARLNRCWPNPAGNVRAVLAAAGAVAVASLVALVAQPALGEVGGSLILVLGIIVAGALAGLIAALVAAFAAFLVYNFFFAAPLLSFHMAHDRDLTPLIVFVLCGGVAGVLAGRLKDRARAADRSNRQLASLLETSRALQSASSHADIALALNAAAHPGSRVALHGPDWKNVSPSEAEEMASVRRLNGGEGLLGVLVLEDGAGGAPDPAFLAALANLAALALERARLSDQISDRRADARAEALKTALLASVSHDFRTPLTAISASASSLIDYRDRLDAATSDRLLLGIVEECDRLNRYTANLLEMGRLESGEGPGRLQTLSVSDMLGAVIQRIRARAGARTIEREGADGGESDLLVTVDAALFELVLFNVLDNAIRYSPDGSRIRVASARDGGFSRIAVADEGVGVASADLERIFERFYRAGRAGGSPPGTGLGLAIARGFVEALGGDITAAMPGIGGRGMSIVIRLPLAAESGRA